MKIGIRHDANEGIYLFYILEIDMYVSLYRKQARKLLRGSGIRLPKYKSERIVYAEFTITKPLS